MSKAYTRTNHEKIARMTTFAILVAIVILFQMLGSFIKIGPTSITLVLVPIVLGGILLGPVHGALLGFIFGAMTLWAGISGTDPFTNILFVSQPYATTAICIVKATLAGLGSGLIYKLVASKNKIIATFAASAAAPIINTGIFIIGGLTLVGDTLTANFIADGTTLIYFVIIVCVLPNFVGEFIANVALSPAVVTITNVIVGKVSKNNNKNK